MTKTWCLQNILANRAFGVLRYPAAVLYKNLARKEPRRQYYSQTSLLWYRLMFRYLQVFASIGYSHVVLQHAARLCGWNTNDWHHLTCNLRLWPYCWGRPFESQAVGPVHLICTGWHAATQYNQNWQVKLREKVDIFNLVSRGLPSLVTSGLSVTLVLTAGAHWLADAAHPFAIMCRVVFGMDSMKPMLWAVSTAWLSWHIHNLPLVPLYLWWSLCTLYLHACQVRVTVGDSGLCCCACVTTFKR